MNNLRWPTHLPGKYLQKPTKINNKNNNNNNKMGENKKLVSLLQPCYFERW
jgi:hypothetical protein